MKLILAALALMPVLLALPPSASARDCSGITDAQDQVKCLVEDMQQRSAEVACELSHDDFARAECLNAWRVQHFINNLCDTDSLRNDKMACLERKVEALNTQLAGLRRDLPRLIDERVKYALQPRVHR